jgi:acetyl esterase/lipase
MQTRYFIFVLLLLPLMHARAQDSVKLHLWPDGAPGHENLKDVPEIAKDYYVKNIHNPSIAVYLPSKEKATGAAVIICPGGGFNLLVYNSERIAPARYLNSIGVAAIILKYRLFRADTIYSLEKEIRQDAYRAVRTVRSHAAEWNIDTNRVGMWGFSAGGEVVTQVAYSPGYGDPKAKDPIDRLNGKPDFQILVYPGPLGIPNSVPADAPKAFFVVANNDACCSAPIVTLLSAYRQAKVPVETHIFANGDHAFNMGYRTDLLSLKAWPQLLTNWMIDSKIIQPK